TALERGVLAHQLGTGFGCVPTSSMGRLFDAVSSLAGVRQVVDYEAEAAIELEGMARTGAGAPPGRYRFRLEDRRDAATVADPGPVVRAVVEDVLAGVPVPRVARAFHDAVATLIVDLAEVCREQTALSTVALGGGVFQNALLVELADRALTDAGFTVLVPRILPANDGGIALGQILIGASA
ncbi:MAG: carbamoyltransferase HypF, partial [Actinomycetota bacterium]|nr:carbamoyltransferase HypF [Actinomycetota bacterium]